MKVKWMRLVIGCASGIALAATLVHGADMRPMVVKNITGNLHIVQKIPCDTLTRDTPVTQGRILITPAEGVDVPGGKSFVLIGFTISFAPFTMSGSCIGVGGSRHYSFLSVQLRKAVAFTAFNRGDGVLHVTIPKDEFLISEVAVVDDRTSEKGVTHPSQDVTGTIDLRRGTVAMHAVVARSIRFNEEDNPGTLTLDLSGTIAFPDSDGDGVADRDDNCRFVANPDQSAVATPIITAPPNLTLASCADHHIGFAKAADICDGGPVTIASNAGGTFVTGSNIVTWTARDTTLRTATDTQNVTIADTTPPIFTLMPPDITMNTCGPAALGVPTATDDCAGTPTFTNNAPRTFPVGPTVVAWTARDASGNGVTDTQKVTVTDTVRPTVACLRTDDPDEHGRDRDRDRDADRHRNGRDHDDDDHDDDDGPFFRVSAVDACTASPAIRLGMFVLANGEVVQITQSHKPGIAFLGEHGHKHIKHFRVGPGQNVITATDGSGNRASAVCPEHR